MPLQLAIYRRSATRLLADHRQSLHHRVIDPAPVGDDACCSAASLPQIGTCKNKWGDRERR